MKVLFLTYHGFSSVSGISKKMLAQVEGLRQCGHEVHVCSYDIREDGHRCRFVDGEVLQDFGTGRLAALRKRICYGRICDYCRQHHIEWVYARSYHNANPFTIRLFRRLRKAGVRSVMEIPTYPYDQEYLGASLWDRMELAVDRLFRQSLAAEMEGIVTFSAEERIFGQRTIRISNGIDFGSICLRKPVATPAHEFHLLGVAEVHYWHGYDRVLQGLAEYAKGCPQTKVFFHIVGGIDLPTLERWKAYVTEQGISDLVTFHGQQQGEALTEAFDKADFAIGSLGRHRSGIDKIKTLKNREYAARGIAFIYSETDEDFDHQPYVMKATADESPIDIQQVMDFARKVSMTPSEIRNSVLHLSWKEQMGKVLETKNHNFL